MLMQAPNIGRLHDELHGSLHLSHKNFDLGDINRGIARGDGARDRNRTCDLRVTSALLYRLSYTGGGLKLAPHRESGNLPPSAGNHTLGPEAWLQVIAMGVQVLLLGLFEVRHIAQRNKNQQTNGQHAQCFPRPPGP